MTETIDIRAVGHAAVIAMAAVCASGVTAKEMTPENIVSQCTSTINQYAHYRDQLDAEKWAGLFTENGVFVFPGMTLTGRKAIAKRIRDNDGSTISRHLTGSIDITVDDNNNITARSYVYVYQADKQSSPAPVPASKYIVAEYHDDLRLTSSGCKFARREAKIIFMSED